MYRRVFQVLRAIAEDARAHVGGRREAERTVLAERDGRDDEDLLGESDTMRRVVSIRQRISSKTASWSQTLARQQEKLALKQQKRVLFALRTMELLRRLDRGNLQQIFSMTTVRFVARHGL